MRQRRRHEMLFGSLAAFGMVTAFLSGACANATLRHQAVIADTAIYESLAAFQDAEETLYKAKLLSPEQHQAINVQLVKALRAGKALNSSIRAWQPGERPPVDLAQAAQAVKDTTAAIIAALPDGATKSALLTKIWTVEQAIVTVLLTMAGV